MHSLEDLKKFSPEELCELLNNHLSSGRMTKREDLIKSGIGASWSFLTDLAKKKQIHKLDDRYYTKGQLTSMMHPEDYELDITKEDIHSIRLLLKNKEVFIRLCDSYDKVSNYILHDSVNLNLVPSIDMVSSSIRVDKKTWEDWKKFCMKQYYNNGDLISRALYDFMQRYN